MHTNMSKVNKIYTQIDSENMQEKSAKKVQDRA